jgi:alpha-tubulin suppressor-like RCC1 family protein
VNSLFEFGTPTNTNSLVPVPGALGATFSSISTGGQFGCGIGTDAIAYCWGNGVQHGELGNGTTEYGMKATRVNLQ